MRHLDLLLLRHPQLRSIDFQRLVQSAKADPAAHWPQLVEACAPVVHTLALRMTEHAPNAKVRAEEATRQVFEILKAEDYRIVREYVGYGKFPSLLARLTQLCPAVLEVTEDHTPDATSTLQDPDGEISSLDDRYQELLRKEGEPFLDASARVISLLHRADRLLLALRFEQELTLAEIDQVLRLGTPARVAALIERVVSRIQPLVAVADAWELDNAQRQALTRVVIGQIFARGSMATADEAAVAPATQGR